MSGFNWLQSSYNPCQEGNFCTRSNALVKFTLCEKNHFTSHFVEAHYVNTQPLLTPGDNCGKLLWKTMWIMWKSMSFQQVFPPPSNSVHNVENWWFPCAKVSPPLQKTKITLPLPIPLFRHDYTEIVGKNGHPVCQKPFFQLLLPENLWIFHKTSCGVSFSSCWGILPENPTHTGGTPCRGK